MSVRSSIVRALSRLGGVLALALLAGCATTRPVAMEVTSPPPPSTGSAPIAAYDAYARAIYHAPSEEGTRIATLDRRATESAPLIGQKPAPIDQTGSD